MLSSVLPRPNCEDARPGAPATLAPAGSALAVCCASRQCAAAISWFAERISAKAGAPPCELLGAAPPEPARAYVQVTLDQPDPPDGAPPAPRLRDDERYRLRVRRESADGEHCACATLSGATLPAVARGLETLLQLCARGGGGDGEGIVCPECDFTDAPELPWRGLLVDPSRHFLPAQCLSRVLRCAAAAKLNVLHLHLSDDQGFRIESEALPELNARGGEYYTRDELRALVAEASALGVRVVPEVDVPGHSTPWLLAFPELAGSAAAPPQSLMGKWGISEDVMSPALERTFEVVEALLRELAEVFPDEYVHVGGDEVRPERWLADPQVRELMAARGLKTTTDVQLYFNQRVYGILKSLGKKMIGWDEIAAAPALNRALGEDVVVQRWRKEGPSNRKLGFIMSEGYYLDHLKTAEHHYSVSPTKFAAEYGDCLGGEACMWGECISPNNIDTRIWPRLAAISERLWTTEKLCDADTIYERIEHWRAPQAQRGSVHSG